MMVSKRHLRTSRVPFFRWTMLNCGRVVFHPTSGHFDTSKSSPSGIVMYLRYSPFFWGTPCEMPGWKPVYMLRRWHMSPNNIGVNARIKPCICYIYIYIFKYTYIYIVLYRFKFKKQQTHLSKTLCKSNLVHSLQNVLFGILQVTRNLKNSSLS